MLRARPQESGRMHSTLVIVDMQNDFITGSLASKEAEKVVPKIVERVKSGFYDDIFATRDTHLENYMDTLEGKKLPVPHCIKDTEGWQIQKDIGDALKEADAYVQYIDKYTFGSLLLPTKIKDSTEQIDIVGVCTDICVVSNALSLRMFYPNMLIRVIADECAGVTPELHEAALKVMQSCQIDVVREDA